MDDLIARGELQSGHIERAGAWARRGRDIRETGSHMHNQKENERQVAISKSGIHQCEKATFLLVQTLWYGMLRQVKVYSMYKLNLGH